jgi:hypothetical protein
LNLIVDISNKENVEQISDYLIKSLDSSSDEFKEDLILKFYIILDKHSINADWKLEKMFQLILKGGKHLQENIKISFISLIMNQKDQSKIVHQLYKEYFINKYSDDFTQLMVWTVGEYGGDYLVNTPKEEIIETMNSILKSSRSSLTTKQLTLTCLVKLSSKFTDKKDQIEFVISKFKNDYNSELQQRSFEFSNLIKNLDDKTRSNIFQKIPILESMRGMTMESSITPLTSSVKTTTTPVVSSNPLFDTLFGGSEVKQVNTKNVDILDLFGPSNGGSTPKKQVSNNTNLLDDLFSTPNIKPMSSNNILPTTFMTPTMNQNKMKFKGWEKDGIRIDFEMNQKSSNNVYQIIALFSNSNSVDVTDFEVLVAVPKYLSIKIKKATSNMIASKTSESVFQEMEITNNQYPKKLTIKVQITYSMNGTKFDEKATISDFPQL